MAKIKLTKSAVDAVQAQAQPVELHDTLVPPVIPLAIRLQFEFAARCSEIVQMCWEWVDLANRRLVWPDSKTCGMSKPISQEAHRLLSAAPRVEGSPYVLPSTNRGYNASVCC